MSKNGQIVELDNRIKKLFKKSYSALGIIMIAGLLLRIYYVPFDIPITLDALSYFFYATDVSILHHLPNGYSFPNNGWPVFVSFFFSLLDSTHFLDYMNIQRLLAVVISTLTVIPVYLLCRRFVEKRYAVIGAMLFAFDPRIIQNSTLGETQPLFIFLVALSSALFLSKDIKLIYTSFGIAAFAASVRYEGLLFVIPLIVMYVIRFRKDKKNLIKIAIAIGVYLIIIAPISYFRIESTGQDGLTNQVAGGAIATEYLIKNENGGNAFTFIGNGFVNLSKFLGWVMIPTFVFFVPVGIFWFLRKIDSNIGFLLFIFIIMLIPALYAYARDIQDTRYLYVIFPIFSVVSAYVIRSYCTKIKKEKVILGLIVCCIITGSLIFLEFRKIDHIHEIEAYEISKHITESVKVTNNYYPETKYARTHELSTKQFPFLINGTVFGPRFIDTAGYTSLETYIASNRYLNLNHLVLDGASSRAGFLNAVYNNESDYPYLTKIYDSKEQGFKYHVKIFEIDYEKFSNRFNQTRT